MGQLQPEHNSRHGANGNHTQPSTPNAEHRTHADVWLGVNLVDSMRSPICPINVQNRNVSSVLIASALYLEDRWNPAVEQDKEPALAGLRAARQRRVVE